jgi:hypothetical protein
MQARAADLVALDETDVHARSSSVQGSCVATRTTTDDDDVELLGHTMEANYSSTSS